MQNTCENSVCMFAEAGLNFSLNLHIRNILVRAAEDKGGTDFDFSGSHEKH